MTTTTKSDFISTVMDVLGRFIRGAWVAITLEGQPVPASRPRVSRWGVYYPKTYSKWRKLAERQARQIEGTSTDRPVIVVVEAIVEKAKTSKLTHPTGDVDNYAKGPLDILTGIEGLAWDDDRQIISLVVTKRFAEPGEAPCFNIWYAEFDDEA